jgi:CBS domain-containing protein
VRQDRDFPTEERDAGYADDTSNDFTDGDDPVVGQAGAQPVLAFVADEIIRLAPSTPLRDAAIALRNGDTSIAVVEGDGGIEGVVSERDLVAAIANGLDVDTTTVAQVESSSIKWAVSSLTVGDVAEEMLETYVRHILVADDDGELAGVVSMRDLLGAYVL